VESLFVILAQAAAAFGSAAVGKIAESAVSDGWAALKNAIVRKRPDAQAAPAMIEDLRSAPTGPQSVQIAQSLEQMDLSRDPDVANEIRKLIATLKSATGGTHVNAPTAQSVYGDQVSYGSSTRTYNVGKVD